MLAKATNKSIEKVSSIDEFKGKKMFSCSFCSNKKCEENINIKACVSNLIVIL